MVKYVRDIMTSRLITLEPDDTVDAALNLMRKKSIHSILIRPPRGGRFWRIFTETDLLLAVDSGNDLSTIQIGDYASPVTYVARPEWTLEKALEEIIDHGVKHLPVKSERGDIVGMVSTTDIIKNLPHYDGK